MKGCKDKQLRIYSREDYYENVDQRNVPDYYKGKVFLVVPEDEIRERYFLEGFYYINKDYDPNEDPSEWNRKYASYDQDDYAYDLAVIYDVNSYKDEDDAWRKAWDDDDWSFFCQDDNFVKAAGPDSQRIIERWDGHNWKVTILEDDVNGCEFSRHEDLELCTYEKVYSNRDGQGTGHDEIFKIYDEQGKHLIYAYHPVSYWQGEFNDRYFAINPDEVDRGTQERVGQQMYE